jgi:WXG100 family type VII secretion target
MSTLRLNFDDMLAAADDADRCASDVRASIQRLEQAAARLTPTWSGRARSAFDESLAACAREMSHFPLMLDQIHAALIATARTVGAAEQSAAAAIDASEVSDTGA